MDNGGWTLIGETGGYTGSKYTTWLRDNINTGQLTDTAITRDQYACIDAVDMAVNHATKVASSLPVYLFQCLILLKEFALLGKRRGGGGVTRRDSY